MKGWYFFILFWLCRNFEGALKYDRVTELLAVNDVILLIYRQLVEWAEEGEKRTEGWAEAGEEDLGNGNLKLVCFGLLQGLAISISNYICNIVFA